jgi:hypothetical protein
MLAWKPNSRTQRGRLAHVLIDQTISIQIIPDRIPHTAYRSEVLNICESNYLRIVLRPSHSQNLAPWNFYLWKVTKFERPFLISECIPWALVLCNAQICVGTMLSILYNILSAPARMYDKKSKDFPDTLYLHFASFALQLLFQIYF